MFCFLISNPTVHRHWSHLIQNLWLAVTQRIKSTLSTAHPPWAGFSTGCHSPALIYPHRQGAQTQTHIGCLSPRGAVFIPLGPWICWPQLRGTPLSNPLASSHSSGPVLHPWWPRPPSGWVKNVFPHKTAAYCIVF